jgi:ABC-type lipoprotein export system ATPase subunit
MIIRFDKVVPLPLLEYPHHKEGLWNNNHEIKTGEKVLINAASGKGKTTFTHVLMGLRQDYIGRIFFDSKDLSLLAVKDWLDIRQKKLSVVFQDLQLLPSLTCEENLLINTNLKGGLSINQLKEWAEFLGIETKWTVKAGLLSMGQQQRLALLRGLSQPFETIVLDEPFSHLDDQNTLLAIELIEKRCTELNAGFLLTTLDPTDKIKVDKEIKL